MTASAEEPGFIAIIQATLRCLIFLCVLIVLIAIGCLIVNLIPSVFFISYIFFAFLGFFIVQRRP